MLPLRRLCPANMESRWRNTSTKNSTTPIHTDWHSADSLLPCLAKVLESIVGQWISSILEPQFDSHQFGCRRNRSTTHALTAVLHAWQSTLDRGGAARAILVDYKKAFNLVNHNLLLQKLFTRGVPHCLLDPSTGSPILSHRREVGVILTPRILWCILSVLSGVLNAN